MRVRKFYFLFSIIFAILVIFLWLIFFRQQFKADNADNVTALNLAGSATASGQKFTIYSSLSKNLPANANFTGLSGSISISSNSNNLYQGLFIIQNIPADSAGVSKCPAAGEQWDNYEEFRQTYPTVKNVIPFILKGSKPSEPAVNLPIDIDFPVGIPMTGCVFVSMDGGDSNGGDSVTMQGDINFEYKVGQAISPAPQIVSLAGEYCFGQGWGCASHNTITAKSDQAFAKVKSFTPGRYFNLLGIFGDVSSGAFTGKVDVPVRNQYVDPPDGGWETSHDVLVYKDCSNFALDRGTDIFGPRDYYNDIPNTAVHVFGKNITGFGKDSRQKVVNYSINKLLTPGSCLVNLTKSNAPNGGIDVENQIIALVQPADGALNGRVYDDENGNGRFDSNEKYIKDVIKSDNGCTNFVNQDGVKIKWSGPVSGETVAKFCNSAPYFSAVLSEGNYNIEILTPSGWEATTPAKQISITKGGSFNISFGVKQENNSEITNKSASDMNPGKDTTGQTGNTDNASYVSPQVGSEASIGVKEESVSVQSISSPASSVETLADSNLIDNNGGNSQSSSEILPAGTQSKAPKINDGASYDQNIVETDTSENVLKVAKSYPSHIKGAWLKVKSYIFGSNPLIITLIVFLFLVCIISLFFVADYLNSKKRVRNSIEEIK